LVGGITTHTNPFPTHGTVITDAGLETWLLFRNGVDLPAFVAYPLVGTVEGQRLLREYYGGFVEIAKQHGNGSALTFTAATTVPTQPATGFRAETAVHAVVGAPLWQGRRGVVTSNRNPAAQPATVSLVETEWNRQIFQVSSTTLNP